MLCTILLFDSVEPDPEILNPNVGQQNADKAGNRTAKEAGTKAQSAATAESVDMVRQFQQTWGPHYAALQDERLHKIKSLQQRTLTESRYRYQLARHLLILYLKKNLNTKIDVSIKHTNAKR